jgi:MFS family permease
LTKANQQLVGFFLLGDYFFWFSLSNDVFPTFANLLIGMAIASTPQHDPYSVLKNKEFLLFIITRFCITMAVQIQGSVVGYQIYHLTGDKLSLGLIGLAEAVPSISVSLFAGHIVDIFPRKRIIIFAVVTLIFCSLGLLIFSSSIGFITNNYGVLPIYIVIFISGIARGFFSPAVFAFMPQLIKREQYANAVSWNSTLWQIAAVIGPALGGFIIAISSITWAYAVDFALMLIPVVLLTQIGSKPVPPSTEDWGVKEKLLAGLKFVFKNQIVLSAISLDLFAVLFGGAISLLPVFATEILKVGPKGFGILRSAPAIGSVIMAAFLIYFPIKDKMGKKLLLAVAGFGVCMILFALSENFWISLLLLVMSGVFDSVSVIVRGTLVQTLTPDNMKGRVSAVNSIFIGSSNEIGAFESGVAAELMGTVPSVIFGGCMTLLVVLFTSIKAKKLRQLNYI